MEMMYVDGKWVFPERISLWDEQPEWFKEIVPYSGEYHDPPIAKELRALIKEHNRKEVR